ncbi:hypothetical protein D9611_013965 [Ephemerocybe angulata]|uniref:F-box domain-containing protein n=1 Tax=Ephemerocybe angulata TaxID=980116 RepID=A0A8H5AS41_9AGAR|nr:hypothetical protein D9611_013965 [Tulosesus angulatus]
MALNYGTSPQAWELQYRHLWSTNNPPTPMEKATIWRDVANARYTIALLQNRLGLCRMLLAPIRRLPLETLGRIFELSVTDYRGIDKAGVVKLCLVCKAWWRAAQLTHSLWTDVSVDRPVPLDGVLNWLKRAGALPKTLRFSTQDNCPNAPPVICEGHYLWWGESDDEADDDDAGSADEGVANFESVEDDDASPPQRCKLAEAQLLEYLTDEVPLDHLRITPPSPMCIRGFLLSPEPRFTEAISWTTLRSLELNMRFCHLWPESEHDPATSMFNHLPPSLLSLSIDLPRKENLAEFDDAGTLIYIPASTLGRLISFKIRCDWDGPQIATLLQHCERLEDLTVEYLTCSNDRDGQEWTGEPDFPERYSLPPQIRLPHLRTFVADGIPASAANTVLHFLSVPALVSITVTVNASDDAAGEEEYEDHPARDFLQSLGLFSPHPPDAPTLHSLTIGEAWESLSFPLTPIAFMDIALDLASLKRLVLHEVQYPEDPFLAMRLYMESQRVQLLPRLEYLEFDGVPSDTFPLESFFHFLQSRCNQHISSWSGCSVVPRDSLQMVVLRLTGEDDVFRNAYYSSPLLPSIRKRGVSVELYLSY